MIVYSGSRLKATDTNGDTQNVSDAVVYAILTKKLINGGWDAVYIDDDRKIAKKGSTKNWNPKPTIYKSSNVPPKLKEKIKKKLKQLNIDIMV